MKTLIISLVIFCACAANAQNLRQNASYSLFSDQKASHVGDAVTIIVMESSQASNNAETTTGRSSSLGLKAGGNVAKNELPGVDLGINSGNDFSGAGSTKTTGLIKTKISAMIDSVLANGNLIIKGSRKIVINGEEQIIFIRGIVRGTDIRPDNSVLSYNISEAEIIFEGNGLINNAQKPGWLTRFFHWLF